MLHHVTNPGFPDFEKKKNISRKFRDECNSDFQEKKEKKAMCDILDIDVWRNMAKFIGEDKCDQDSIVFFMITMMINNNCRFLDNFFVVLDP